MLLLLVRLGVTPPPYVSATFLAAAFQILWHYFGKCQRGQGRHDDTEAKMKTFLFHLCIVDLDTIIGFSDKFNKTSKT